MNATFYGGPLDGETMAVSAPLDTITVSLPPDPPLEVPGLSPDESPTALSIETGFYDLFWKDAERGACKYTYRDPSPEGAERRLTAARWIDARP